MCVGSVCGLGRVVFGCVWEVCVVCVCVMQGYVWDVCGKCVRCVSRVCA